MMHTMNAFTSMLGVSKRLLAFSVSACGLLTMS